MQQNVGSCLGIQSVSLCLFIGDLSALMLRDIRDQLLVPAIFVVRGRKFECFSSFEFVVKRLILAFFLSIVSHLVLDLSFYYHL